MSPQPRKIPMLLCALVVGLTARPARADRPTQPGDPYREPVFAGSTALKHVVYTQGSTNQGEFGLLAALRLHAGARAVSAFWDLAAGTTLLPRGSIASQRRGSLFETGLGLRYRPLRTRYIGLGIWLAAHYERTQVKVEIDAAGDDLETALAGRKTQHQLGPELGLELNFPLTQVRPGRPWWWSILVASSMRLAFPTGSRLEVNDGNSTQTISNVSEQLGVLGPMGGASVAVWAGAEFSFALEP